MQMQDAANAKCEEERAYQAHLALRQARSEARAARQALERQRQEQFLQQVYPTVWAAVAPNGVSLNHLMHNLLRRSFDINVPNAEPRRVREWCLKQTVHYARHLALFLENEQHPLVLQNRVHMQNGNMDALNAFMTATS